jgi:hypothetical protein
VRWADLERDTPRLAQRAREKLIDPGVLLVGTMRRDGTPRVSAVEPLLLDGDLWLSMMWRSQKAEDLFIDSRILVHSIVTSRDGGDGEVKIRGRAVPIDDPGARLRYCDAVEQLGWRPVEPTFHLFVVDVADVTAIPGRCRVRSSCDLAHQRGRTGADLGSAAAGVGPRRRWLRACHAGSVTRTEEWR